MVLVCRLPTFQRKEIMTKAEEKKKTKNTNNKNSLPIKYIFKIWICEKKKKALLPKSFRYIFLNLSPQQYPRIKATEAFLEQLSY